MGIDGRLLLGNGIMINPLYLPKEYITFLELLLEKYPDIFTYNRMNNIKEEPLIIWGSEIVKLFPGNSGDRRPLIINNNDLLKHMNPLENDMNLDSEELWVPSYQDFIIRLDDFFDWRNPEVSENLARDIIIKYALDKTYEIGGDFLSDAFPGLPEKEIPKEFLESKLHITEAESLSIILNDKRFSMVGKFLVYIAD